MSFAAEASRAAAATSAIKGRPRRRRNDGAWLFRLPKNLAKPDKPKEKVSAGSGKKAEATHEENLRLEKM